MKNYKKLKIETNKIIKEIKDEHFDEFSQVEEFQTKIDKYYKENEKNYSSDVLLQMYKFISNEKKSLSENMKSVFNGIVGGAIVTMLFELTKNEDNLNPISLFIVIGIMIIFAIILLAEYLIDITKNDSCYKMYYFDKVHVRVLEKLLSERGFCLFKGEEK